MRQIILDTETTGLEWEQGHRIIEIGCIELIGRRITKNRFHTFLNPGREIDFGALEVHGIQRESLLDKPEFADISGELMKFLSGSELIIHNAKFDIGFLNHELSLIDGSIAEIQDVCTVQDTLQLARQLHPGQRNSLDALCKRYGVDNSHRVLHGAMLDAEILADVYLLMTGGQSELSFIRESDKLKLVGGGSIDSTDKLNAGDLLIVQPGQEELKLHKKWLKILGKDKLSTEVEAD
jgi:DNA polymerase-3 subunit epsilon